MLKRFLFIIVIILVTCSLFSCGRYVYSTTTNVAVDSLSVNKLEYSSQHSFDTEIRK